MDQFLGSHKLATYLHPGPSGPFLEFTHEPLKPPSPLTKALLQNNPSLLDICTFNCLCQRLVETSSSSNNNTTSSYKPFINPSELLFCMPPPITSSDFSSHPYGMFHPSSFVDPDSKTRISPVRTTLLDIPHVPPLPTTSPISSAGDCSPNVSSSSSTPTASPSKPLDLCVVKESPTAISNTSHRTSTENIPNCDLSNFPIKVEPRSNLWPSSMDDDDDDNEMLLRRMKPSRTSPILHRLLSSSQPNSKSKHDDEHDNTNGKSPQYRSRHCFSQTSQITIEPIDPTRSTSRNGMKDSKTSRQSCRSPVFTRRPQQQYPSPIESDGDTRPFRCDTSPSSLHPMALLSLDTNGIIVSMNNDDIDEKLLNERHTNNSFSSSSWSSSSSSSTTTTPGNHHKRPLESPSTDQIMIKRRYQKPSSTIITQRHCCTAYPTHIQRCVDCQTISPHEISMHLAGCRFQHCRTLKYFGKDKYEIEGFTTAVKAKSQDTDSLRTPNSGGEVPLTIANANQVFVQISKLFCLMFLHEQAERASKNEKRIIWKRYMAGWREVCDECSTTLFNFHYMCKVCGYMVCIECWNECSQMTIEKRRKFKRLCNHDNSFNLSEFIPWDILLKLRNNCIDYMCQMRIDYTIKLQPTSKNDSISTFIKTLKMKRSLDARDIKKKWTTDDSNHDVNIEFYCDGRLPVFNEWISENAKMFFRKVWTASSPVLVKRVHRNLSKTLWRPESFKEHMLDHHDTPALWDCETLTPILTNETILARFWDGFERLNVRLTDDERGGRPRILKLKDWPTKKDFASVFPSRLHDLMNNIPFGDYTRRSYTYDGITYHGGSLNIVERLPACLVKPDLGPKLYIAYSQLTSQATRKAGTTNLHIDVSDAVNVLVYVGVGGHGDNGLDKDEELRQVEAEILQSNIDEAQLQRLRNGEHPGALWHLFRSDDVKKIREYISRSQRKIVGSDPIHDQTTYLEKEDLEKLRDWSKVESYPVLQFLGDAVFIPSGAPHQVKNFHSCIKIAEDFVSPENLDRCLITTNEFRSLSKTHTNHADILQAKNILYYATRDALHSLTESTIRQLSPELCSLNVHI